MSDLLLHEASEVYLVAGMAAASVVLLTAGVQRNLRWLQREARLRRFIDEASLTAPRPEDRQVSVRAELQTKVASLLTLAGERAHRLTPDRQLQQLQRNLAMAGYTGSRFVVKFLAAKVVCAVLCAAAMAIAGFGGFLPAGKAAIVVLVGAVLGFYLPGVWLGRQIARRQRAVLIALPDALDLLTISVGAGLGFDGALIEVVQRWRNPLTDELAAVQRDLKLGRERRDALRSLADRTGVTEVMNFAASIIQADELGTPIREALRVQAEQLRQQRRQKAEERARKAVVKMLVPMVLFIFPSLFVVLIGPAAPSFQTMFSK